MANFGKSAKVGGISTGRFEQISSDRFEETYKGGGYFCQQI